MNAIEVSGLAKKYGRFEALRGVDLSVGRGEVFGLVGPNGAGKTTLIKSLVGALRPAGGEVRVMGLNPLSDRAELRRRIGYMPQGPALYEDLSARGNVAFFGAAHRAGIALVQERTMGTMERMFINGFRRTEIIAGYVLGFLGLATFQAVAGLAEAIWLFELDYDEETLVMLFVVVWLLAIASVMLGIFISTFARHEGQVFPFVPLIIVPSVFLSGLLIDVSELPNWADWLGHAFPLFWANDVIQDVIESGWTFEDVQSSLAVLAGHSVVLLLLASRTLREVE